MPNINKSQCSEQNPASYKDVVIIGNGPSGLCLSYFLAGNWPYWNRNTVSNEFLQMRLEYCDHNKSLVEQDLEFLSDGLEGRSNNPVAILYDLLKQPDSDLGLDKPTCLTWKYDPLNEIDHVVIGKSAGPGGAWNDIEGTQLTISPNKWMELPDMSFINWKHQNKPETKNSIVNVGLVFSSKDSNFSEDSSLLNANYVTKQTKNDADYNLRKYLQDMNPDENARASMNDVRNYYRDYAKQKNMEKYLLNNATVTNVRRICYPSCVTKNKQLVKNTEANKQTMETLWEVTGLIDRRDRRKASSLSHGDINEFRFVCKHLVLACGANDLNNTLNVKGENFRYIIRNLRELEDKILEDVAKFQNAPLLIVGAGLTAADALLLARKHKIKVIHVIRRSVHDPELVFKTLPKHIYPEYHEVYEMMLSNRYVNLKQKQADNLAELKSEDKTATVFRSLSQNDLNNNINEKFKTDDEMADYTLYDEHEIKWFTSKRTCKLIPIVKRTAECKSAHKRHLQIQKQLHELHKRRLSEFDEEQETSSPTTSQSFQCSQNKGQPTSCSPTLGTEFKISYACVFIGCVPDLDFLPQDVLNNLAINTGKELNTKNNPILVDECSHETSRVKNLYAMGPLIGDNFVRFGTGGALAISNRIIKTQLEEQSVQSPCPKSCMFLKAVAGVAEA